MSGLSGTNKNTGEFEITVLMLLCLLLFGGSVISASGQMTTSGMISPYVSPGAGFAPGTSTNYLKNSAAFRQEIVRMEINVVRGTRSLPITQVPRVQKDDVIKMKLLDEAVGGIRPSESLYDWTFLVAFVNPNRRVADEGGRDKKSAVSEEVRFKKTGWYKQYSFAVPYDSQPVFFLYPKPNYRSKILKVVSQNYNEVRKLGDKTIEIAGAYSQISSFLNELQYTLYQTQTSRYYNANGVLGFGGGTTTAPPTGAAPGNPASVYNPYGANSPFNPFGSPSAYNPSNPVPLVAAPNSKAKEIDIPINYNYLIEQSIERMARSFNLQLPSCWGNGSGNFGSLGGNFASPYGSGSYGSSFGGTNFGGNFGSSFGSGGSFGNLGGSQNNFGYAVSQELFSRAQCVAKNIRLEDFDLSVASMLQQGGIMLAAHLRDKYPQLAYWINLAAAAIDFIVKVFQKAALRIVPTIVQASDSGGGSNGNYGSGGSYQTSYAAQSGYTNNFNSSPGASGSTYPSGTSGNFSPTAPTTYTPTATAAAAPVPSVKLALYAESQPDNMQFVTAYPIVVHKWQQEPDPEVISIPPPVLAEPCLHAGVNILKNTAIGDDPEADTFMKDFKLTMSGTNGFKKEFPLKKNIGLGGWELNLTKEDLNSFPKIQMLLESVVSGVRGFNEIKSPAFVLPLSLGGAYELKSESQKAFSVGGKRFVTITNPLGGCRCLQAVIYKPNFGGQFVYEASAKDRNNQLQYSPDGREVSFEIDAGSFQPGAGQLILFTYGGEQTQINIKLYALPPNVTSVRMAKGDSQAVIAGERLEQLQYVKINGRRATVVGNNIQSPNQVPVTNPTLSQNAGGYPGQPGQPNQTGQPGYTSQSGQPNQPSQSSPSYQNPIPPGFPGQVSQNQTVSPPIGGYPNNSPAPNGQNQPPVPVNGSGYPNQSPGNSSGVSAPNAAPFGSYPSSPSAIATTISPSPAAASVLNLNANERLAVFDDPTWKLTESAIQLELGLEDDRRVAVAANFPAQPSRPAIVIGTSLEIEAQDIVPAGREKVSSLIANLPSASASVVIPVETAAFSLSVKNQLTDYDFKIENLLIETRLEKSGAGAGGNPAFGGMSYAGATYGGSSGNDGIRATFEVLDWKNLRLNFVLNESARTMLGGRRIQFRIRDKERADSDWYTIRQTFVRTPVIEAVVCTNAMNGQCELTGVGIDYIGQVSTDGGATWFPEGANTLQTRSTDNGRKTALVPAYANKKMLLVKLRDYPPMSGISVADYTFINSVKAIKKPLPGKTNPAVQGSPASPAGLVPGAVNPPPVSGMPGSVPTRLAAEPQAAKPPPKKRKMSLPRKTGAPR